MNSLVGNKRWSRDRKKIRSRAWYLQRYREIYKVDRLPSDLQYWTMAGNLSDGGKLGVGSELDQLLREKFIEAEQYHGVEIREEVHARNVTVVPPGAHLYNTDLVYALDCASREKRLRPGVLNIDSPFASAKAVNLLAEAMEIVNLWQGFPVMLVWNVVRSFMYRTGTSKTVLEALLASSRATRAYRDGGWSQPGGCDLYEYDGTGHTSAKMSQIIICRGVE